MQSPPALHPVATTSGVCDLRAHHMHVFKDQASEQLESFPTISHWPEPNHLTPKHTREAGKCTEAHGYLSTDSAITLHLC